jgi:tight adherence protein B
MLYLLLFLVFITIVTLAKALYRSFSKVSYTERLEAYLKVQAESQSVNQVRPVRTNLKEGYNAISRKLISALALSKHRDRFDRYLEKANILFTVEEVLLIVCSSILLAVFLGSALTSSVFLGIVFGVLVIPVLRIYINNKIHKKLIKFEGQLCDALDMIVSSLRGGFSFLSALELISKDMPEPISGEFAKLIKEISLGASLEKALNNLVERVASEDLKLIFIAIVIQIQTGGNLAEILDNISSTIRERLQLKREVKTLTAQGKISGLIVGLLPVILFVAIFALDPSYMKLLVTNIIGICMLVLAATNELIGFLIIRKIVNIEY